jgi:hypothetical protein
LWNNSERSNNVKVKRSLLALSVLLLAACNAVTQPAQATQPPVQIPTGSEFVLTPVLETTTFTPTAADTPTQIQTDTPVPAPTEPPLTAMAAAMIDSYSATMVIMVGSEEALINIGQYFNPVGAPLQNWHDVSITSQATAGQEYSADIYTYIATATFAQARQFYQGNAISLGLVNSPGTDTSGSGNQASHNVDFVSRNLPIVLTSFDNDTGHVIVVISKIQ